MCRRDGDCPSGAASPMIAGAGPRGLGRAIAIGLAGMGLEITGLAVWLIMTAPFVLLGIAGLVYARGRRRHETVAGAPDTVAAGTPPAVSAAPGPRAPAPAAPRSAPPAQPSAAPAQPSAPPAQPMVPVPTAAPIAPPPATGPGDATRWPAMATPAPRQAAAPAGAAPAAAPPAARPAPVAPPAPPPPAAPAAATAPSAPSPASAGEPEVPAEAPPPPRPDYAGMIAAAEAAEDVDRLPTLYVALARQQREDGLPIAKAADLLRKSIRLAATHRQHMAHAVARIELGDLERESGDLTSACEHWQIARSLFHDMKLAKEVTATDTRMRRHGCPTDWVLNDF